MLSLSTFPSSIKTFGYSMFPILKDEDIVYQKKIKFPKLKVNDIICIRKWGKVFTHRVIFKSDNYVITKGDHNQFSDGKIYSKNVIGIVYKIKRGEQIFGIEDLYLYQSTLYFQEIVKIKRTLENERIRYVLLKGLPLHLYFEGSYPKRIYADCDILVKRKDFQKVKKILEKAGYRSETPISVTGRKLKNKAEISFIKVVNGFPVVFDIHKELVFLMTRLGDIDMLYPDSHVASLNNEFIGQSIDISINNENFKILNKENLFVYLCLHLFNHNYKGIYRYDFITTILKSGIDVHGVAKIVDKYKLRNFIYPSLLILKKYYKQKNIVKLTELLLPTNEIVKFSKNFVKKIKIFDDGNILGQGNHFRLLFQLSPNPMLKKVLVFLDPKVSYAILWVIVKKITFTLKATQNSIRFK